MIAEDQYLLLWKGRQSGPFSVGQIREKLLAGDISRMHQINADGRWQILDEYMEKLRGAELEVRRAEQQKMREAEVKRQFEAPSNDDRGSLSHLIPREAPPPPPFQPGSASAPGSTFDRSQNASGAGAPPPPFPVSQSRMSGFAITALVMGLCNFVPFVNFASWILALVFGHIALSQMKVDDSLKGRGIAIAGLVITYFLLVVAITVVLLCLANNRPLPFQF